MGAAAAEADRTLFVGNLEAKVTEEILFELFHQAGPVIKVKIPKDKDGKPKQFAFVNFKHEVSVPYAMNLLNGIKLFGRPIKIQFRSGSSHALQDVSMPHSQYHGGNSSPTATPTSPSRYERPMDNMIPSAQTIQRSFSSPENFQRQAVMKNVLRHMSCGGKFGSIQLDQPGFSPTIQPHNHSPNQPSSSQWRQDTSSSQRKVRHNSHPYVADRHYSREHCYADHGSDHHYRGSREDFFYEDRNHDGWSHDYDNRRDNSRDGKWRSSRH
ncbi:RNA-binding protein 7 isoform X2 [Loxodonta africana]|uniref:RNA-binding protein 7 n=2 Tax=Loxodonta africana TaxID=9785 RepID=G3T9E4_LOXAF|nr:RNA-binding protein 7 isoform X2 [Loxodonta africana]XP_049713171.1 RNA-binding protein 7 isoform X2 [Elephas maximus indicus]